MRLLVVEDNQRLSGLIAGLLTDNLFAVDVAATIEEAQIALATAEHDLVLLDLSLPDGDGGEILRSLRRAGRTTRILVATARSDVVERVDALNGGADDYLVKPFSLDEQRARIRALLRRPPETVQQILSAGRITLDTATLVLRVGGEVTTLPRRELTVMISLLKQQGRLVSRKKLEDAVYSFDAEVTPNAIEAAVSRLRRRLEGCDAGISITAMRGLGYILAEQETA